VILTVYAVVPLVIVDLHNALVKVEHAGASSLLGPILSSKTTQSLGAFLNKISSQFISGGVSPLGAFSDVLGGVALGISVLVSSFYLSLSRGGVERFILAIVPADMEEGALRIYERSIHKIGYWFRSQLLLSLVMGGLVLVSLLILGVKYAFLIALLTAIFELMPIIGPIISGSVATIAALTTSPQLALYTLVVFVVIHQLESHVLVPILVGRGVGLHPVVVIIALLIGAEAGGFLGIVISVPAAVVFQEIVEHHSDRKKNRRLAIT
jgi:predicted PurR-regulated permease PerM